MKVYCYILKNILVQYASSYDKEQAHYGAG